jgi:hypothetical protein
MMEVDLTKTDKDVVKVVTEACQKFGHIKSVNLYRAPKPHAMVRMEDRSNAFKVANSFGQSTFDGAVMIPLKQRYSSVSF